MNLADTINYDQNAPRGIRGVSACASDGVTVRDFTYRNPVGRRMAASLSKT